MFSKLFVTFSVWFSVIVLLMLGQNALGKTREKNRKPKPDTSVPAASDQKGGVAPKETSPGKEEAPASAPPAPAPNGNAAPSGGGGW